MSLTESEIIEMQSPKLARFLRGDCGLHHGIPFPLYLRQPIMSQSVLKCGRKSMKALKYAVENMGCKEPTDDMMLGSATHTAFLEPEKFHMRVVEWTGPRRAGSEWREFKDEHADKIILTSGYYENLRGMVEALRSHPEVRKWIARVEDVEVSAIGMIQGMKFKGRCDALTDDPLWDLKKVVSVDDRTINAAIDTYAYHLQGCIYREIFNRDRFCLGFVEGTPPHDVRVVELSPAWLKIGKVEMGALIQRCQWCEKHNDWPGCSDKIETLEPPEWKISNSGVATEITIGDDKMFGEE